MSILRTVPDARAAGSRTGPTDDRPHAGIQKWGVPALLATIAYIPLLATKPGMIEADTKQYLFINPGRLLANASSLWDPNVGMGTVTHQTIGYLFPMGPFFWVFNAIGVPTWVAQRLWLGSILFAAGMGVLFLIRTLASDETGEQGSVVGLRMNWGTPAITVAALAFMLSPYVLQYEARISGLLMCWAALPWLTGFVARALRVGGWRYPALFAVVTNIVGAINAPTLLYALIGPLLWFPYAVWILREVSLRRALATLARTGVLTALLALWWLAGLATQAGYGLDILRYSETVQAVALASLSYDILRGLGFWFFYGQDSIGPWIQSSVDFTRWPWLILVSYAVPAAAFLSAAVIRWRHRLYFIALIGIAVAIAVGVHPYDHPASPLGSLLKSFATGSTLGFAMRNAARAIPLLALGVAVLLGAGIEALATRRLASGVGILGRPWLRVAAAVTVGGLVVADMAPLWAGQFVDNNLSRPSQIPSYYQAAANYVDAQGNATRVLALPGIDFAAYRWGNNLVDPVEPGLLTRPFVAREQIPYGSPPSADLLVALDNRFQEGTFDPSSLAPLARLMGVGQVELRSDLQYERYQTARTKPTFAQFDPPPPGLGQPVGFGPPATDHTSIPLVDEQTLGPSATTPDPASLQMYGVTDPRAILRAEPTARPLVVAGNGDGLVDGAAAGLLGGQQTVLYQANLDTNGAAQSQALNAGADLVLTDTNRKRTQRWDTIRETTGYTQQAGEQPLVSDPNDNPLPLFPGANDSSRTVTSQGGIASVQASAYGNPVSYTPADRPDLAMDGDLSTAWTVAAFTKVDGQGQYLRINTTHPVNTDHINVVQPLNGPRDRYITQVTLRFDHGPDATVQLGDSSRTPAGQTLTFPGRTFSRVDLVIDKTNFGAQSSYKVASGVGFAELRVGGGPNGGAVPPVDEVTRLPTDLLSRAGTSSIDHRLVVVMTRLRSDPSQPIKSPPVSADEERAMARSFSLPTPRTFSISGSARISADAPDGVVDQLLGRPTSGPGSDIVVTSSSRLPGDISNRGESAFDGDPTTFWSPQIGDQIGQWLQVQQPRPVTFDHLNLSVVADGRHSVPTSLRIQADGQPPVIAEVPPVADRAGTNATVQVPVSFPAVTGSTVRVTIDGVRQESTVDYQSGLPSIMPVGIADLGIPGVTLPPVDPTVPSSCRTDLLTVDGNPVGLQVVGSTASGDARQALQVQPCGPGSAGLSLGAGDHVLRTTQGSASGIDLDQLVLGSERGGAALATGPSGQIVAPASTPGSAPPSVRVLSQDRTNAKVAVDVPPSKGPFWLVLGQSFNNGWTAQVDGGGSLGSPRSIDGYANGWLVQPQTSGQMLVTLHWKPQDRVNLALYVSAAALALCLLLIFWRPRRPGSSSTTREPGVDTPARPELVSPLRSTGRAVSRQTAVVLTLASAAVAGFVIGPWAAPVVALAIAVVLLRPRLRALLTIGAVACVAISGLYVAQLELRYKFPAGSDWPSSFSSVTWVAWLAVALLVVDAVLEHLRSIRHRPG